MNIKFRGQLTDVEANNFAEHIGLNRYDGKLVIVMKHFKDGSLRSPIGKIGRSKRIDVGKSDFKSAGKDLEKSLELGLELHMEKYGSALLKLFQNKVIK